MAVPVSRDRFLQELGLQFNAVIPAKAGIQT